MSAARGNRFAAECSARYNQMHELPVTQSILNIVMEAAQRAGAPQILAVDLVIGDLSSIVDDSVQFYFDILSKDTIAEGATLRIRREAATAVCLDCGAQSSVSAPLMPVCAVCGGARLKVSGGREFYIESIEVEDEDSGRTGNPGGERSGSG